MALDAGQYKARILNYGMRETQKGDPAPTIAFNVKGKDGANHKVFWQGSLVNKAAQEIALKALIVCGMQRVEDLDEMGRGLESGVLDTQKEIDVSVEIEVKGTNSYPRVQWINAPGEEGKGGGKDFLIEPERAKSLLASLDLSGAFEDAKSKLPAAETKGDIPF